MGVKRLATYLLGIGFLVLLSITVFYFERMNLVSGYGATQLQGFWAIDSYEQIAPLTTMCGLLFVLTLPKRFSFVVFGLSVSVLSLTLLLNYGGNGPVIGSMRLWSQIINGLASPTDHTLNDIAAALLLPIGSRLASFANAFYWFGFLTLSFLRIRVDSKPFKIAVTDTLIMGSCVLGVFALSICLIDPFWTFRPVTTHWQDGTILQFFSNFDLFLASAFGGSILMLTRRKLS